MPMSPGATRSSGTKGTAKKAAKKTTEKGNKKAAKTK